LLCSDRYAILERIEFIVKKRKKAKERERGHFLPEEVEEQVENTTRNVGIMGVKRERELF
jgi:hypothetical protein